MARYEYQCGETGETPTCLNCGAVQLRKLDNNERPADPVKAQIEETTAALVERRATRSQAEAVPRLTPALPLKEAKRPPTTPPPSSTQRSASTPPPPPPSSGAAGAVEAPAPAPKVVNLDDFEKLLKKGVKAVVICGGSNTGKSEIAHGFTRARKRYRGRATALTLGMQAGVRYDIALGGTEPGTVWYQLIDGRRAFLDPSGEFFQRFSPTYRRAMGLGDITETHFDFVRSAVRKLAGVVVVFDLTNPADPDADEPWAEQETIVGFTLDVIRWLRYDKRVHYKDLDLMTRMSLFLEKKKKKLDVPVLVLFSKADQLAEFTNEHPLVLLKRELSTLHAALLTNVRKFRVDYVNTMVRGDDGIDRPAKYPCGVLLPVEWLFGGSFRWLRPLPTSILGGGK
jgi:GTP-binding protein EngB required for normal cell division